MKNILNLGLCIILVLFLSKTALCVHKELLTDPKLGKTFLYLPNISRIYLDGKEAIAYLDPLFVINPGYHELTLVHTWQEQSFTRERTTTYTYSKKRTLQLYFEENYTYFSALDKDRYPYY